MDSLKQFLVSLSDKGIIDEPDHESAFLNTKKMLEAADSLWKDAVVKNLKDKIKVVEGNAVLDPKFISESRIVERVNGHDIERPIADLVQQGGGMYGIALVGYTYIMEKAGVRFFSHGGTSAGAINALFLSVVPKEVYQEPSGILDEENATKSELLAHIIANTDFSKFMDRSGITGWIQSKLLRNFSLYTLSWLFAVPAILFAIGIYASFGVLINSSTQLSIITTRTYDYVLGTLAIIAPILLAYLLLLRILGRNFGINTGDAFYDWAKSILQHDFININTQMQLQRRLKLAKFEGMEHNEVAKLVLISSNLSYNRIVKFPKDAASYWTPPDHVNPAAYIRASMSVPFIFNAFVPSLEHVENNQTPVINESRFVDGGMLSNFPIREFHSSKIPRFPTFGVLLSESEISTYSPSAEKKKKEHFYRVKLWDYILSFLSTFRNFYDNDFLLSSDEIRSRVVTVNTKGFNWLNFWMDNDQKLQLFIRGAEAAIAQLEKFDWEKYKQERIKHIVDGGE